MIVRVAVATALVFMCVYASPASEGVETSATESTDTTSGAAHGSAPIPRAPSAADGPSANPYTGISNEQLADVAHRWAALNQDERRWFFIEVRKRLRAADGAPEIPIGPSARFGQVVRDGDGTVTPIETRATAQPAGITGTRDDPRAYGIGFERRLEVQAGSERSTDPPQAGVRMRASGHQRPGKSDGGS